MSDKVNLDDLRHSASHLLAAAVTEIWPNAKPTLGPPIESGFYYDFDFGKENISDADLPHIEEKMREIVKFWKKFEKKKVTPKKALEFFKNNDYKIEMINDLIKEGKDITFYKSGDFVDLCGGGHIPDPTQNLRSFKLLSVAGAYWRGSEKNKMLTRIYGTAFSTQKELRIHLTKLEEAKKRDHRKIGRELNLFAFSDLVGKGLPMFTKQGSVIRRELERFIVDEETKRGYEHVYTPDIAKVDLYEKSGHYPYYKDSMYPVMQVDEEKLILRPMTCPHHFQLFASVPRSYRELPLRIAELARQFRYEKSGELSGLMRVRMFTLADSHIFCTSDQAESEIMGVLDLIEYVSDTLGLSKGKDYRYRLSKGDRNNEKKFYKDDKAWDFAESVLRKSLVSRNSPFYEADGEAAFYGPKIDVQMKNVLGKEDTAFTVQYDFVLPKRFETKYIGSDGNENEPVVIHRSSIGALERVVAFLIEKYEGSFPVWLSPVQAIILPITDKQASYAKKVYEKMKDEGIRCELDDRSETLQAKIRDAQVQKIPYMIIIGEKEVKSGKVSVRLRSGRNLNLLNTTDFIKKLKVKIEKKSIDL